MNVSGIYVVKGDSTCDGRITIEDMLLVQMHLLGNVTLTGDAFTGADTNNDNNITIIDIGNVQKHLLGVQMLTGVVAK